jgi:hypothetical protein
VSRSPLRGVSVGAALPVLQTRSTHASPHVLRRWRLGPPAPRSEAPPGHGFSPVRSGPRASPCSAANVDVRFGNMRRAPGAPHGLEPFAVGATNSPGLTSWLSQHADQGRWERRRNGASASLQASNYIADRGIEVDPRCNPRGSGWLFRDRLVSVPENPLCPLIGRGLCNLPDRASLDEVSERSLAPDRSGPEEEYNGWTGPAARTPAETPKAVDAWLARETMEPRRTEFSSQGRRCRTDISCELQAPRRRRT